VLPSCITLTNDNIISGTLAPSKIAAGNLPPSVVWEVNT
jgi:hypothetical protein